MEMNKTGYMLDGGMVKKVVILDETLGGNYVVMFYCMGALDNGESYLVVAPLRLVEKIHVYDIKKEEE